MYKTISASNRTTNALRLVLVDSERRALPNSLRDHPGLTELLHRPGFRGEPGEVAAGSDGGMVVGVGPREDLGPEVLRKVGAALVRALHRMDVKKVEFDLRAMPRIPLGGEAIGRALGEGIGIANWRMDLFDGAASRQPPASGRLVLGCDSSDFHEGLKLGLLLADAVNFTRRMAATPPNVCTPAHVASTARTLARNREELHCSVITYQKARQLGMGGLENVGKGSANKPCMIMLDWKPAKPRSKERLVMVGKTITFDTGGYTMKSGSGMKGMKYDKNGGMAVLGAMKSIAEARLPVRVTALLPAAENMVSSSAYRPDDIIEMYNGITVEVTNTDAEGRLVLADALAYACDKLTPTAIVDVATLTGGVVVALGPFCAGYWCEDRGLRRRLEEAADRSGERIWRLPLWQAHRDFMRSNHADLLNSNPKRAAHPIQGAAFLSHFVEDGVPWAHLDIAGTSTVDSGNELQEAGPTGWGVRTLFELAEGFLDG
ncbi:MAG: leucyl aminopeptidase family protein [Planctomycetota bacterium]|nr:leucyl aminopeptidase family protein [Planctomycetota bacterium]